MWCNSYESVIYEFAYLVDMYYFLLCTSKKRCLISASAMSNTNKSQGCKLFFLEHDHPPYSYSFMFYGL